MENNLKKNVYTHTQMHITEWICCMVEANTAVQVNYNTTEEKMMEKEYVSSKHLNIFN